MDLITQIRTTEDTEREAAARRIMDERRKLLVELQESVKESLVEQETQGIAKTGIRLLGHLRAIEAVPMLVENLTFQPVPKVAGASKSVPTEEALPCVGALTEIGLPSLGPLMKKVAESGDRDTILCAALVANRVLGTDLAVLYVKGEIARESAAAKKQRLMRLMERIEQIRGTQ